jgi:hypothetical protein
MRAQLGNRRLQLVNGSYWCMGGTISLITFGKFSGIEFLSALEGVDVLVSWLKKT